VHRKENKTTKGAGFPVSGTDNLHRRPPDKQTQKRMEGKKGKISVKTKVMQSPDPGHSW
jgi:hypothetical protein